jgi:hypothetical protein
VPGPRARIPGAPWLLPGSDSALIGDAAALAGAAVSGTAIVPPPADPTPLYSVTWVNPLGAATLQILNPYLTVSPSSSTHVAMQVQFQSSLAADFSSPSTTTFTSVPSDVNETVQVGPFINATTRYFRARAGDGSTWGEWAYGPTITFNTALGNAHQYAYENVGLGTDLVALRDNHAYAYENAGVEITLLRDNHAYAYEGDVNTLTPTPHIWFIKPASGRSGDGFVVYGHGFGAPQAQYSGVLQFFEAGVWTTVGVVSWTLVAATAHAYDSLRLLDPTIPYIDAEHNEVQVTIPNGLVPPGYLLRIETNGA